MVVATLSFWTPEMQVLGFVLLAMLGAMIVLPILVKLVDEQLGYFFMLMGGVVLWLSMRMGIVRFEHGSFAQNTMHGHEESLVSILAEPKLLLVFYFVLSLLAIVCSKQIEAAVRFSAKRLSPPTLVGLFILVIGSMGSVSVVVMATLGGIFFSTLQRVTHRGYTPVAVVFSAAIGISALLTTVGEPLSLFIARNLGEGTPYLLRTYGGIVFLNVGVLAVIGWLLAKRAMPLAQTREEVMMKEVHEAEEEVAGQGQRSGREVREALTAVKTFEREEHSFVHRMDQLLHSTAKLYFFVIGLLLFGEGVKPIAAHIFGGLSPIAAFFGNSISAVADNALLGLLEVQSGMPQHVVLVLGLSLAFWGVGLVPGNVCNIVLKEKLEISFGTWARYGIPLALVLAVFNLVLVLTGAGHWLTF
jgi:predicted cation transporter